ncbi:MAG: class I SAM-dependent methyltransferase [Actinomycetota bacterium]|nr:class I SAM-dependent methyltransferase [Actinomycetota bacterium]
MNRRDLGQKFARLSTNAVLRSPRLWRFFRPLVRRQFDAIAASWDTMRDPTHLAPYEAALAEVDPAPSKALDLGTGTGQGAFAIARRFPHTQVVGVDLAEGMLAEARRKTPAELAERVRFESGDASALPFEDSSFALVAHANMIPFFDELERVLVPGGQAVFAFSLGPGTPIYVTPERLREELGRRGFAEFAEFAAGKGTALLARKEVRA